jgi:hypothetical protein
MTGREPAAGGEMRAALEAARTALRAELEARGGAPSSTMWRRSDGSACLSTPAPRRSSPLTPRTSQD